jgi:hypothetical protein
VFDVFVDGATGTSRDAVRDLADAMAARYGLAAVDLRGRLMRGPFRVKADVDRRTADAYLRDLVALGARARIEPAGGRALDAARGHPALPAQPASRPPGAGLPPALGRPTRSSLPPQPAARPSGSALASTRILDAAAGAIPTALGALDRSGQLSLATLDDEPAPSSASDGTLPASMGPAAPRPDRPARSRNEPLDPFAPPELAAAEPVLELADDELAHRARRQQPSRPPMSAGAAPYPGSSVATSDDGERPSSSATARGAMSPDAMSFRGSSMAAGGDAPPAGPAMSPGRDVMSVPGSSMAAGGGAVAVLVARIPALASARVRLAVGVWLAIVLGFVPAHLAAGMRERSAYAAIDRTVASIQSAAATPEAYAALDAFRADQLDAKRSARRSIIATAMVIWAAAGGALAYAWFRHVPWGPLR